MLPIMVNMSELAVAVIGNGFAAAQRLKILQESGASSVATFATAPEQEVVDLAGASLIKRLPTHEEFETGRFRIVYLCDLPESETQHMLRLARGVGALTNVHDRQDLCDFHMPAILRRGNLQVTVSTDGKVAGLSRILRDYLRDHIFGPEWGDRVDALGKRRADWVKQKLPFVELKARVDDYVAQQSWLPRPKWVPRSTDETGKS